VGARPRPLYVIQKHAARSLHYDLRLEVDGVLKSWAVPKGPSTDPSEKRLAIEVPDHSLAHGDYEGPDVEIWDRGTYRVLGDAPMSQALADGHVSVWIEGERLRGGYTLQRTRVERRQQQWLLIKRRDEEARGGA
jgi:DNA ligase D-like protein (predicted 3'-phosphoesterase)